MFPHQFKLEKHTSAAGMMLYPYPINLIRALSVAGAAALGEDNHQRIKILACGARNVQRFYIYIELTAGVIAQIELGLEVHMSWVHRPQFLAGFFAALPACHCGP